MRGYPDVSAIGQDVKVYSNGEVEWIGGTSASAPIIASIVARLNNLRLKAGMSVIGELNPHLYRMDASSFNKIPQQLYSLYFFSNGTAHPYTFYSGNNISDHFGVSFSASQAFTSPPVGSSLPWDPVLGLGTPRWSAWEAYFLDSNSASTPSSTPSPTPSPPSSTASACGPSSLKIIWLPILTFIIGGIVGAAVIGAVFFFQQKRKIDDRLAEPLNSYENTTIRSSHNIL